MSGKRGPSASSFGPISGLSPIRLMWSVVTTIVPGRHVGVHAADGVGDDQRARSRAP